MKKFVYGSGLFLLLFALGAGFYASYQFGVSRSPETEAAETAALSGTAGSLDSYALETEAKGAVGYILKAENDRVVVYCADGTTLFEYTDILVSDLPYELQAEIRNGKEISGTAQLYSFLENYSS